MRKSKKISLNTVDTMLPVEVDEENGKVTINGKSAQPKELAFLKLYFDVKITPSGARFGKTFGDGAKSVRAAGYDPQTDRSAASRAWYILNKFNITQGDVLRMIGLDDAQIARTLKEGIHCKRVELAKFEGKITDQRSYPDYLTRHKYVETAIKLKQFAEEHEGRTGMGNDDVYFISLPPVPERPKAVDVEAEVVEEENPAEAK
jgi:hypothetical protein